MDCATRFQKLNEDHKQHYGTFTLLNCSRIVNSRDTECCTFQIWRIITCTERVPILRKSNPILRSTVPHCSGFRHWLLWELPSNVRRWIVSLLNLWSRTVWLLRHLPRVAWSWSFLLIDIAFVRDRLPGVIQVLPLQGSDHIMNLKRFQILSGFVKPNVLLAPSITPKEWNDYRTND